ncbi:7-cyano-7-deazaguanine synthase [Micromonospora sp. NPDC000442]|uniref:7-cyano-7-deazaguanine synthase n=1 Tax=Micromonospora sp. NPDC000442 TaxID=3364217 RepID=UPI0036A83E37
MSPASFAYHYPDPGPMSLDPGWQVISRNGFDLAVGALCQWSEVPWDRPSWAEDLLHIARAIYLADKLSLRDQADDRWTRQIDLCVQVRTVDHWTERALALLSSLAEVLSADRWRIRVRPGATALPHQSRSHYDFPIEEVALFSGGLDSVAYAAERSLAPAGNLLLVSYFEPKWKPQQDAALAAIDRQRRRRIWQFSSSQQVAAPGRRMELSARTRGLIYSTAAVYFAAAHRVPQVCVPENGQLALNPPLTPARAAACSTRSVHPLTLWLLNEVIREVGGSVIVTNPYVHLTKGEVCRRALHAGLSPMLLSGTTVSCGHPSSNGPDLHCGHCYPCLMRHSGLFAALGGDATPYGTDVWSLPDSDDLSGNRRALQRWLSRPFGVRDLFTDLPVPEGSDLTALVDVVQRGRTELTRMIVRHGQMVRAADR